MVFDLFLLDYNRVIVRGYLVISHDLTRYLVMSRGVDYEMYGNDVM